jgi:hypothetical protein
LANSRLSPRDALPVVFFFLDYIQEGGDEKAVSILHPPKRSSFASSDRCRRKTSAVLRQRWSLEDAPMDLSRVLVTLVCVSEVRMLGLSFVCLF